MHDISNTQDIHYPVMLTEVLENLAPKDGDIIVDGTFGAGGYSRAILESCDCTVYAIDRDPDAVKRSESLKKDFPNSFFMLHGCFGSAKELLLSAGVQKIDGIVLDLGVSSPQIDERERGFSFKKDGPLDMRMSQEGLSAKDIVNTYEHGPLAHIIKHYGEERMAGKIASAIVRNRIETPYETTFQLADTVRSVVKKGKDKIDPATRTFQGIRIAVNNELGEVEKILDDSINLLNTHGRLVVVSFHSLEDRIVKKFIQNYANPPANNRHSVQIQEAPVYFSLPFKKMVRCSDAESSINTRSRSAKLRTAIRNSKEVENV